MAKRLDTGLDWWERAPRSGWAATCNEAQPQIQARTSPRMARALLNEDLWRMEQQQQRIEAGAD